MTRNRILVAGLINIETTLKVDGFPVEYEPARYPFFGVNTTASGVGLNIAKALTTLRNHVDFLSLIAEDVGGALVRHALREARVNDAHVLAALPQTPQSVIVYDPSGKRAIFTDLKDVQDRTYPAEIAAQRLAEAEIAVLCNINFTRPLLAQAKSAGVPIATDVHAISNLDDAYNRDYMAAADILFQSHENLPCTPEDWARQVYERYHTPVIVIGCGAEGAVLMERGGAPQRFPAVRTRPVVNSIGAGDALFSAFVHRYRQTRHAEDSLRRAMVFASYKIGVAGAADGFLTPDEWDVWLTKSQ